MKKNDRHSSSPPERRNGNNSNGRNGFHPIDIALTAARERLADLPLGRDAVGRFLRTPTGKISWRRNLYAIWVAQLLAIMGFNMRTPFMPMFLGEIGVETTEGQALWTGIILSVGAGMMAFASPFWGAMADRKGRKPMLLRSQFGAFLTIGLTAFVLSPWQMLGLRVVEGVLAGTVTAATALIATTMPRERLGYGLGLVQTAVFSGSALGPLVGGILADAVGYRETFVIASLMLFVAGLITLFVVQERFTPVTPAKGEKTSGLGWGALLGPALLALVLSMLVIRFASSAVQPIVPLFVEHLAHTTSGSASTLAGLTLGVMGVTSAISSVIFGRVGDKKGHFVVLFFCSLGSAIVYFPMALSQHPWHLIVLQAVFGIFAGGMMPSANALVANITDPARRGTVFGMTNTFASMGGFLGPLAGSGLAATLGLRATFVATGGVLMLMVAGLWAANQRTPMTSAPPEHILPASDRNREDR
jgi:DHA1 family multidrug resistance protein-like MFS transporter